MGAPHVKRPLTRRSFLALSLATALPAQGFFQLGSASALRAAFSRKDTARRDGQSPAAPVPAGFAQALVLKNNNVFLVTDAGGAVPLEAGHGLGLYYHDCRFLSGYELLLNGMPPVALAASAGHGFMAKLALTNPPLGAQPTGAIRMGAIGLQWERAVDGEPPSLHDRLLVQNFGRRPADLVLALTFQAAFEDVFIVRGHPSQRAGTLHEPAWQDGTLHFFYEGRDGMYRSLAVQFDPPPRVQAGTTARFAVHLDPRQSLPLHVSLVLAESTDPREASHPAYAAPSVRRPEPGQHRTPTAWLASATEMKSDSPLLNRIIDRSLVNLAVLQSRIDDKTYFVAGTPWFGTLFGRDSLITALQTLAFDPDIAAQTLRLLAAYQGRRVDDWRDEQPGKILHELRVGELARRGVVPHTPYYGSIDAVPLFLILLGQHASWTGSLDLFRELRANVERALDWLSAYGDRDGRRYLAYATRSTRPLDNQGWKDSGEAIVNADGSLAVPPIALVEAQGYVYLAKLTVARLYDRLGESDRAGRLRREAARLRRRFNRDFWLEDLRFYALALQKDGTPAAVVSSNPGQALWTGIIDPEKAGPTVTRLMAEDMFTGWGIRTLSARERSYNPLGYHVGTVWPHDNSLIVAGARRYGQDEAALRTFSGLFAAAMQFKDSQLPELFAGFSQADYETPVPYPTANPPQAWASGSMLYLLTALLGLVPEAFERRLRIVRPLMPDFVDELECRRLRVGPARVDCRFTRDRDRVARVQVLRVDGDLDVVVS